jgi:magnesium transporter
MERYVKKRSRKSGLPPGTLVHIGAKREEKAQITFMNYDESRLVEKEVQNVEDCFLVRDLPAVSWINIDGVHQMELIEKLGAHFNLHPLVLEDIANTGQRPKLEDYGDYLFIVLKMLHHGRKSDLLDAEQLCMVVGPRYVITFQEKPGDVFDPVRERIRTGKGRSRRMGADYLAYALIDAIVDDYFAILEHYGERIEAVEENLVNHPAPDSLRAIHRLKSEMIFLRRSVWPLREVINVLERGESPLIQQPTTVYLRDVYDHTVHVIDTVETFRDLISGMLETYLSSMSNRMNEVMKVLTIIATIFMPLTFIAGIYGMNFSPDVSPFNMPELHWQYGYPAVIAAMGLVALGMIWYFKKKKWF